MGKLCDRCSQVIPAWDDHPVCVKCRQFHPTSLNLRPLTLEGLDACLQNLYRYLMRIDSRIFQRVKPLIAKQARSELLDRVANFCGLEREDPEEQKMVMGMTSLLSRPGQSHNNNLALSCIVLQTRSLMITSISVRNLTTQLNLGALKTSLRMLWA